MNSYHSTGKLSQGRHAEQNWRYRQGHKYDFIFIGSGMTALTSAALLAHAGYKVCILEAHDVPGGYAHSFTYPTKYGKFSFCAQVHYIWGCGPGGHIGEFLKKVGLDHEITFELLGPYGYDRMVMPDNKQVYIPYGYDKLAENIEAAYPGQGEMVQRFTKILERIREEVKMLPDNPSAWQYLTKWPKFLNLIKYRTKTLQDVFDECGLSRESQAVLIAQAGDFMAPPNELSIFAYMALFGGYNTGAYYPTRHFNHFIETIVKSIESHPGCHIYYETAAAKILTEGDEATGIETADGKLFKAERYVCNMDPQAASWMIGREKFPTGYLKKLDYEYSHTGLMLYIGLHGVDLASRGFGSFNTWHLEEWDMNESWQKMLYGDYEKPWIYLGTPTLHTNQPGIAPPGCHILEVGTLGGYDHFKRLKGYNDGSYEKEKVRVRDRLIEIIREKYLPELNSKHIAIKLTGSPTTNEAFCRAPRGNAYGSHLTPKNMGLGRLKGDTPWLNLFFANASAGYGGICPTIGTGNKLYMDLTGDKFYSPADEPPDRVLVELANQKIGGWTNGH